MQLLDGAQTSLTALISRVQLKLSLFRGYITQQALILIQLTGKFNHFKFRRTVLQNSPLLGGAMALRYE